MERVLLTDFPQKSIAIFPQLAVLYSVNSYAKRAKEDMCPLYKTLGSHWKNPFYLYAETLWTGRNSADNSSSALSRWGLTPSKSVWDVKSRARLSFGTVDFLIILLYKLQEFPNYRTQKSLKGIYHPSENLCSFWRIKKQNSIQPYENYPLLIDKDVSTLSNLPRGAMTSLFCTFWIRFCWFWFLSISNVTLIESWRSG